MITQACASYDDDGSVIIEMPEQDVLADTEVFEIRLTVEHARRLSVELLVAARLAQQQAEGRS